MSLKIRTATTMMLIGTLALGACSDAPKQYVRGTPPKIGSLGSTLVTANPDLKPTLGEDPPAVPEDTKARNESQLDIIYGKGAAGITFSTPFQDLRSSLSKPSAGPIDNGDSNLYAYNSGLILFLGKDPLQLPQTIRVDGPHYQGSMNIPNPIGSIKLGHDFTSYFTPADPSGEALVKTLYKALEKPSSPNYDCIKEKTCSVQGNNDDHQTDFFFQLPKGIFVISKDRHILHIIALSSSPTLGKLANDLDLTAGHIDIKNPDGASEAFEIGKSWGELKKTIATDSAATVYSNSFKKKYDGMNLTLTKSRFERKYREPSEKETLSGIEINGNYSNLIKIGGKYIEITTAAERNVLTPVSEVAPASQGKQYLQLGLGISKKAQKDFLLKLSQLIADTLKSTSHDSVVSQTISGFNKESSSRVFVGQVLQYSASLKAGKNVFLALDEGTGNLIVAATYAITNPIDIVSLPSLISGLSAQEMEMGGFKLGQKLRIKNVDEGRDEAEVCIGLEGKEPNPDCVPDAHGVLDSNASIALADPLEGKVRIKRVQMLALGDLGLTLSVTVTDSVATILAISTDNLNGGIKNLCGLPDLVVNLNVRDEEFRKIINEKIRTAQEHDPSFSCPYIVEEDSFGTGLMKTIHFTNQQVKLNFASHDATGLSEYADRELKTVTIYGPRK